MAEITDSLDRLQISIDGLASIGESISSALASTIGGFNSTFDAAATELLTAGVSRADLWSCWPAEIRRRMLACCVLCVQGEPFEVESLAVLHGLVSHILRGLQLRALAVGGGDEAAGERLVRQMIGAVRLAAAGEEAAADFVRGLLADAGDLAFVEAAVASHK